jgi:hypothetical protein
MIGERRQENNGSAAQGVTQGMAKDKQAARLEHLVRRIGGFLLAAVESAFDQRWTRAVFRFRRSQGGGFDLGLWVALPEGPVAELEPPIDGTSELLQLANLPDHLFGGRWHGLAFVLTPDRAWQIVYNHDPVYADDPAWRSSWPPESAEPGAAADRAGASGLRES